MEKPTNVLCPHCFPGKGCEVYDWRPDVCKEWYCGWRFFGNLDDEWRPDLSGIVIKLSDLSDRAITFVILDPAKMLFSEKFASYIATLVENKFTVFFSAVGSEGNFPALVNMNSALERPIAELNLSGMFAGFKQFFAAVERHVWEPDGLMLKSSINTELQ